MAYKIAADLQLMQHGKHSALKSVTRVIFRPAPRADNAYEQFGSGAATAVEAIEILLFLQLWRWNSGYSRGARWSQRGSFANDDTR